MFGLHIMEYDRCLVTLSWDDEHINDVHVDFHIDKSELKPLLSKLFYTEKSITWKQMIDYLERRYVPRDQIGVDFWVKKVYGLREYSPYFIVRKTHGVSKTDYIWIKWFDEESLRFDDVKVRD